MRITCAFTKTPAGKTELLSSYTETEFGEAGKVPDTHTKKVNERRQKDHEVRELEVNVSDADVAGLFETPSVDVRGNPKNG